MVSIICSPALLAPIGIPLTAPTAKSPIAPGIEERIAPALSNKVFSFVMIVPLSVKLRLVFSPFCLRLLL